MEVILTATPPVLWWILCLPWIRFPLQLLQQILVLSNLISFYQIRNCTCQINTIHPKLFLLNCNQHLVTQVFN